MITTEVKKPCAPKGETRTLLLAAGGTEFNTASFGGPDINRIARVAGYAPQTFDRHLAEKTEILIRVHERSQDDERAKIASTMQASPSGASHRERAGFRRSLRLFSVDDDRVQRRARRTGEHSWMRFEQGWRLSPGRPGSAPS
ncbi:hypothetical protein [Phenylobacterium sp.]|jgi:AcrR family transcriptional regulator|uniref:hypothetical protein n=1 Tax=Phenylobacterium sp. TaxID=1871053 RepID=UPI0025CC23E4|nr:hypothetical protein [Phenylobacterium sp.]MCA3722115.1 TetR/AcrR family transcriptional regulator [Phenylobacterium sp.]MCA3740714.1 TetR/AcrR family transcriptional regulator [Phenylobacterium sp.]